ncbi:MAG TPA: hypothetical protein VEX68_00600 [Bryobacteraceae bacterium]|nr:hypothetical protein [Bryobacteraceae bacterium]
MPRKTSSAASVPSAREEIRRIQIQIGRIGTRRASRLANLVLAAIEHQIVSVESDALRMRAIEVALGLEPVKARLGTLNQKEVPLGRKHKMDEPEPLAEQDVSERLAAKLTEALEDGSLSTEALDVLLSSR